MCQVYEALTVKMGGIKKHYFYKAVNAWNDAKENASFTLLEKLTLGILCWKSKHSCLSSGDASTLVSLVEKLALMLAW